MKRNSENIHSYLEKIAKKGLKKEASFTLLPKLYLPVGTASYAGLGYNIKNPKEAYRHTKAKKKALREGLLIGAGTSLGYEGLKRGTPKLLAAQNRRIGNKIDSLRKRLAEVNPPSRPRPTFGGDTRSVGTIVKTDSGAIDFEKSLKDSKKPRTQRATPPGSVSNVAGQTLPEYKKGVDNITSKIKKLQQKQIGNTNIIRAIKDPIFRMKFGLGLAAAGLGVSAIRGAKRGALARELKAKKQTKSYAGKSRRNK